MVKDDLKKLEAAVAGLKGLDAEKKAELLGLIESLKTQAEGLSQIARLAQSIKAFEGAHPKLVELIDELALMLSRIGI